MEHETLKKIKSCRKRFIRASYFGHRDLCGGFTLIEILVSLAIFAIVMTVSTGSVLTIIDANKKSQALGAVMNNVSIALEGMSRNMRVGSMYSCGEGGGECVNAGEDSEFTFRSQEGETIRFWLEDGAIKRQVTAPQMGQEVSVTAPEVSITDLKFYSRGIPLGDGSQPRVIIVVTGEAGVTEAARSTFSLQTTVTMRMLDS